MLSRLLSRADAPAIVMALLPMKVSDNARPSILIGLVDVADAGAVDDQRSGGSSGSGGVAGAGAENRNGTAAGARAPMTRLGAASVVCVLRMLLSLAAIAATKPRDEETGTKASSTGGRQQQEDKSQEHSLQATERLWEQRGLLARVLGLLEAWASHRCRCFAVGVKDLTRDLASLDEHEDMEVAAAAAAAAAERDGMEEPEFCARVRAARMGARQRLVWTLNVALLPLITTTVAAVTSSVKGGKGAGSVVMLLGDEVDEPLCQIAAMDPIAPSWTRPRDPIIARAALRNLAVLLGRRKDKHVTAVLSATCGASGEAETTRLALLMNSTARLMHEKSEPVQELAVAVLQRVLSVTESGPFGKGGSGGDDMAKALLNLLDTHDTASKAVCAFIAASAAQNPAAFLPQVNAHARSCFNNPTHIMPCHVVEMTISLGYQLQKKSNPHACLCKCLPTVCILTCFVILLREPDFLSPGRPPCIGRVYKRQQIKPCKAERPSGHRGARFSLSLGDVP